MTFITETFRHPGPAAYPRVLSTIVRNARELRVEVGSGCNVGSALRYVMQHHGFAGAAGRLCCGSARALQYHVVIRASGGERPYIYGEPLQEEGELPLLHGAVTIGVDRAGHTALHCHAAFVGGDGRPHGGHLILDRLDVGRVPLVVRLCAFEQGGFAQYADEETRYALFGPVEQEVQ